MVGHAEAPGGVTGSLFLSTHLLSVGKSWMSTCTSSEACPVGQGCLGSWNCNEAGWGKPGLSISSLEFHKSLSLSASLNQRILLNCLEPLTWMRV